MADLNLDAFKAAELVVATTLVLPFAKWAGSKLFGQAEARSDELRVLVNQLSAKIDERFASIRNLIEGQNLSIRELQIEQKHADGRLSKLEEAIEKIPEDIEKSRHLLRNELTPLIIKASQRRKDEGDE